MYPPRPRPPPGPQHRAPMRTGATGLLLWVALALLAPGSRKAEAAPPAVKPAFERVVRAWRAGSATDVVDAMSRARATRFTLLAYPLSGKTRSMRPKQARASLKAYFHRIRGIALKDITPRKSPASVRLYEFTYTPERENARTTRLHIQLTRDRKGPWVLASVTESVKPRD